MDARFCNEFDSEQKHVSSLRLTISCKMARINCRIITQMFDLLAPRDGFEPPTNGLTVRRSTTELPGNAEEARIVGKAGQ